MPKRAGRKSKAQTPAPRKERIYGSKKNPKGSAASEKSASKIKLDDKTMTALKNKLKEFKEKHPNKKNITLNDLKAVYRRGAGAYSKSHRPTITGGVPNTRNAWSMARVNKFLKKAGGAKVKAAYVQDDDLLKMEGGGLVTKKDDVNVPLYHGTIKEKWENSEYETYLYVTDEFEVAKNYSLEHEGGTPIVIKIDPNQLKNFKWDVDCDYGDDFCKEVGLVTWQDSFNKKGTFVIEGKININDFEVIEIKNQYVKGGLLAPNGKPSNLTPEQWQLVRTPGFKNWFGDWENDPQNASKVVDENGEPLVVYRGVKPVFKYEYDRKNYLFFTSSVRYANVFGKDVKAFFLNIRKPLDLEYYNTLAKNVGVTTFGGEGIFQIHKGFIDEKWVNELMILDEFDGFNVYEFEDNLKNSDGIIGYDVGNYGKEKVFVIGKRKDIVLSDIGKVYRTFEKNSQAKLADGTNTTFDPNNEDIRYEDGGTTKKERFNNISSNSSVKIFEKRIGRRYQVEFYLKCGEYKNGKAILKNETLFNPYEKISSEDRRWHEEKLGVKKDILRVFELRSLWIDKECRGKGIASQLIEAIIEWAKKNKILWIVSYIKLSDETSLTNEQAYEFLLRHGFELIESKYSQKVVGIDIRKYKFSKGGSTLLAPNGEPSNLSSEQWHLVRTTQFKAWFGDWENDPKNASKVVDENGEPMMVYRGDSSKTNVFKGDVFFSSNDYVAGSYSNKDSIPEYKVFLNIRNPLDLLGGNELRRTPNSFLISGSDPNVVSIFKEAISHLPNDYKVKVGWGIIWDKETLLNSVIKNYEGIDYLDYDNQSASWEAIIKYAKNNGFDGVFMKDESMDKLIQNQFSQITFFPEQIKLADGTNTTFDPNLPDIRFAKGGQTFNDKELLEKWKRGESIGFTATAHLKAKGLIPRSDGTKRKSPQYKKEGGLIGGFEDLTDEWLSKKIEIFLNKVKPIKFYFVDPNTNTLTVGFDKYYSQDAAQKVYEEATSSKEFFHAPSVESTYDSKTGDLVFKIKLKKAVEYSKGGSIVYSAIFFDENEIVKRYGQVHPNLYSHHSTIEFKPQSIGDLPIGDRVKISIVGRLTTDKVDVLLVNNPFSKNKYPHITLSTSEGVKPFESNKEIEQNIDKVEPLKDYLEGVVGYFDGSGDITKYNNGGEVYEDDEYYEKTDWEREQEMLDNSLVDLILHDENYALNLNDRYILSHEKNIEFRNKEQDNERDYKPRGLWYAFNYEWASWVYHEMPRYARDYDYVHKIEVTDKVLRLDTIDKCVEFTKKYGIEQPWGYNSIYKIDWIKVAQDYSGIEVTQPYKWSRIHEHEYTLWWLYGWDVGSGCVWNEDGVKSIELVHSYANGGEINELENYLRNIRIDPTWGKWGRLYRADFGENGVISWEITQSYFDEDAAKSGYDPNNPEFVIVQSMDRDRYGDTKQGIDGSKGEGAKAIASLFLKYSNLKEILYDDYSEGFWQKIGGIGDVLKREDFFKYFNQKNKTNYFNKGGKIKSITDVDDIGDYVPIFIDENVPYIPEDPTELWDNMEDYLGIKIVKSLLKKSNIPIKVLGKVGEGFDGVAFKTDNGTILKVTKNGEEAMNSFLILKNYDNLEGQAKIYNLFIISSGTQKLYFIEKEKLRVAANEMRNFPLDYYDELWRVGQNEDEKDFQYWVKDLAKDWESENNQSVSSKEMKQAFDVVDLSHRIVKDMDVYDLEVNDATPHNVGYFDDDLYCFDCAASNDKILARGGNMKYAKGGEIEFEYLREAEREEVEDFFDGEPNEIARWSEGEGRGTTPHTIYNLGTIYLLERQDYGFDSYESNKYYFVSINESFAKGGEVDEEVIKERWAKKKNSLMNMADNIRSLRTNLRKDLKGDDDKDRLTALAISLMDKTAERVGNDESESNGHLGITGLSKRNVKVEGNTITLKYIGKSGVKQEKQFSDEGIASALRDAIANSQSKYVFETSDGFRIKNDRINRYLSEYDISAKDLRGYSANQWIVSKLREVKDKEILGDEAKRKKKFNEIVKSVAEKVGHGAPTLKKHYMLPSLEREWVNNGKIVDLANIKRAFEDGGEIESDKIVDIIEDLNTKWAVEYDIQTCDINKGECNIYAEELYAKLLKNGFDKKNIEILSTDDFYDTANEYSKEDETIWKDPNDYGSKKPKGYKWIKNGYHVWVYVNGKHYDSESPYGVENFYDLSIFKYMDGGVINYSRGGSPRIRMSEANEIKEYIKKQHEQGKSASWGGGNRGYNYVARPDGVFLSYDIVRNKYKFFNDIDSFVRALYRLQVRGYKKGGDVGVANINQGASVVNNIDYDHLDESQDLPNDGEGIFAKGGDLKFNDIVLYHEKKGNWFVAKNTVYAWLYQDPKAAKKLESGEFEFVLFPPSPSIPMAMSRGYVPPLLKIWTKKYQKETKGADNLLGIVKAWYDEDNKKLYILMMTTRKDMRRKGVNSHIIKNLREEFNLKKDQIIFDKPTKEGEMFSKSGKYEDGGKVYLIDVDENIQYAKGGSVESIEVEQQDKNTIVLIYGDKGYLHLEKIPYSSFNVGDYADKQGVIDELSKYGVDKGEKVWSIASVIVQPKYRGQGVASILMNAAIQWAKQNNYKKLVLLAQAQGKSGLTNEQLKEFYSRYKFKELKKTYGMDWMARKLSRGGEVITYSTKTNEYYDRENKKWVIEPFTIKKGQLVEYSHSDGGRVEARFLAKAGEKKAKIEILHGYSPWTKRVESTQYVNPAGRTEPAYFLKDIPRGTIKTVSVDFIEPVTEKTFELRAKPISRWLKSPEFKEAFGHLDNPTTMAKGGEISDEDKKETYKKWKSLVNMSKSELDKFYNSEEGKVAGLTASQAKSQGIDSGRESARWIMKMKDTSVKDWTPTMWKWAKKQISFISRMSGNKGKLYDESGAKTRKHTSLLIWGHNPKKKAGGGELDIPLKENAMNEITYNELPAIDELPIGKTFVLKEHYYNNQNGKPTHQGCRYLIVENMGDAQMDDCLKLKVHKCYGGGGVTTRGMITRPIKNIMNKGRDIGESLATSISKPFKKGGELDPDKKEVKEYFEHKSGAAGGLLVGKRHSEGGIQAINKSTGQPLEMEGGEVVITRDAVSDSTLHDFNGKQMTNREILSAINESGGGVKFADGGDVSCKCSGKEYKLGGKTYKDYELFKKINNSYGSKAAIEKGMKVEDKEHGETFKMLKNGEITYEQFLKKLVVDHLSENPKYYDK